MRVQNLAIITSDPLLLPCVVVEFADVLPFVSAQDAAAVGIGHFESGLPLTARYRPPTSMDLGALLRRRTSSTALAAAHFGMGPRSRDVDVQPFRFRSWLFTMAGRVDELRPEQGMDLAIPSYLHKNLRGGTVAELLFHQVLAFLHRQGLLASEQLEVEPLRRALKGALTLESSYRDGPNADFSVLMTDGRVLLGAAVGRPVYMRTFSGLSACGCASDDGRPSGAFHDGVRGVLVLDTDALPSQEWETVGPNKLFQVDANLSVESFSLD